MKVLFLISQLPFPADTGAKIRSLNLIKKTGGKHVIDLLAYGDTQAEEKKVRELSRYCRRVLCVGKRHLPKELAVLLNYFSPLPYSIQKYYSSRLAALVKKLVKEGSYDLIHCDSLQISCNVKQANGVPKVLAEHNVESQIIKRYAENEKNVVKQSIIRHQWQKLFRYENSAVKNFDACSVVSDQDRKLLAEFSGRDDIQVVANGVDCDYFRPQPAEKKAKRLVFTGSLDWLPNEDGLFYFFHEIYPLIKEKEPRVEITVVGRNPSQRLTNFADKDSSIHLMGRVEDVRPFMHEAEVFIVPLRIGGGTRLKILEAMAAGVPVISTTIGAEGIEAAHNENILLADSPGQFAQSVTSLLANASRKEDLKRKGRELVERLYSWDIIARDLERLWEKVI